MRNGFQQQAVVNTPVTPVHSPVTPLHTPVLAQDGTGFGYAGGGRMGGQFQQSGAGVPGSGFGAGGDCLLISTLPDGSLVLDAATKTGLLYMIEEEKMARDLYDAFAAKTGSVVFDRISTSEQRHMDSLLSLAKAAGLDTTAISSAKAGLFVNQDIQKLYDGLLTQGSASLQAAITAGITVEKTDIADLQKYEGTTVAIVGQVYANLENGSAHHLAAFTQYDLLV